MSPQQEPSWVWEQEGGYVWGFGDPNPVLSEELTRTGEGGALGALSLSLN